LQGVRQADDKIPCTPSVPPRCDSGGVGSGSDPAGQPRRPLGDRRFERAYRLHGLYLFGDLTHPVTRRFAESGQGRHFKAVGRCRPTPVGHFEPGPDRGRRRVDCAPLQADEVADPDSRTNPSADRDANPRTHRHANPRADSHSDSAADSDADAHSDAHSDAHADADADDLNGGQPQDD
jgi:hypothetical protein